MSVVYLRLKAYLLVSIFVPMESNANKRGLTL
jgi:hypothetical protein